MLEGKSISVVLGNLFSQQFTRMWKLGRGGWAERKCGMFEDKQAKKITQDGFASETPEDIGAKQMALVQLVKGSFQLKEAHFTKK